ncbi:Hint domain-containing protein [Acetobacter sp. DmW_136]|uniref:Hint domain-containing protein n=1 Tax=Acetobacter sp. DmW_136 TaxID=2591091 RepID=UPI00123B23AD|nr:Hint domain-containing protein [Acetobacter sp. DmW_136]KAA8384422.1 Hint domain-containing protein [Acetobacter sp. DmW_136]
MAINLLFDKVIDYSVEDLLNLNVTGNILVTRDAGTPAGDPVVVNLSNIADVQALSRIVVENGATVVAGGGLASVGAIKNITVDGGTLELGGNIISANVLSSINVGPDGGNIKVDSAGVGVGVLSNVVTFIDSNGKTTSTVPPNFTVDFPDSSNVWGYYDPLTNTTTVGLDLNILNVIDVSLGPSIKVSGNPFGLTWYIPKEWTNTSNPDGTGGILICYLAGSMIRTPNGDVAVEDLRVGDAVLAYGRGEAEPRQIVWAGHAQATVNPTLADDEAGYPVRIVQDAIADGVPYKDMLVTPEHCLYFDGRFVPVRMLVNGSSIFYDRTFTSYTYYHIETPEHAVIMADGVLSESYLDTGNRTSFRSSGIVLASIGSKPRNWSVNAAAPLCTQKEFVQPLFEKIANRDNALGHAPAQPAPRELLTDPDICLQTNTGKRIRAIKVQDGYYTFMLPENVQSVQIVSRASRPCDVEGPFVDDRRKLGVAIGQVTLCDTQNMQEISTHLQNEDIPGWYVLEHGGAARWTNGNAMLDLESQSTSGLRMLSMQVLAAGPYLASDTPAHRLAKTA